MNRNEAENFGIDYKEASDRYDRADEFLEIATGLWESWEPGAVQMDRASGMFADPAKVHELNYAGRWLSSRGPLTVPRPPQGWPVLLQAGQSSRGQRFAARWADLVFSLPSHRIDLARQAYKGLKELVAQQGRSPSSLRILPAIQVIVAETQDLALAQQASFEALGSPEEELLNVSEQTNFDFSVLPMDEPLRDDVLAGVQGARGLLQRYFDVARDMYGPDATLRDLGKAQVSHGLIRFVGDVQHVADQIEDWFVSEACDGFAISPIVVPQTYENVARLVIPELRRRGLIAPNKGDGGTFRARIALTDRASRPTCTQARG